MALGEADVFGGAWEVSDAALATTLAQILIDCEPFETPCPEDIDGNGTIDGADLGLLLGAWGTPDADADINGDGTVNGADLGLLLGAWGESC